MRLSTLTPATTPIPRPLSVLQLGKSWFTPTSGGGLDRMFDGLMRHFPQVGVRATGFVAGPAAVDAASDAVHGVAPENASLLTRLRAFRRSVRAAVDDADVVASHFALYTLPVLGVLRDRPLVVHFHGPWGLESQAEGDSWLKVAAKSRLERSVYRHGARFVVLSEAFRDVLVQRFDVDADRVRIVPGGVDVDRFAVDATPADARERLGLPPDRSLVVSVRRLARRMGLENLIDAWQTVVDRCPDALLLLAGTGPLASDLQARIDARGLGAHVRLLGFVPDADLPFLYRSATLSVLPTVALEGFGLTTIESLAAGTPVLVTPVGGLPEVVRDLSGALVLDDASTPVLADALSGALTGTRPLPSADACRGYAEARFAWPAIAAQTRAVYEEVA